MKKATKFGLWILTMLLISGTAIAWLEQSRPLPTTLPDGRTVASVSMNDAQDYEIWNISDLLASIPIGQENTLYYKIIVPNDNDSQWNLSIEFAESKPYALLNPVVVDGSVRLRAYKAGYYSLAWVCCNVTKGDRLYTTDATNDSALRGTLTNMYNINYKTRIYNSTSTSWENRNVGASTNPSVYNRRAALHQDGTQIAYVMETRNVTNVSVPELMKVFLI